jgi:hypothetical protein
MILSFGIWSFVFKFKMKTLTNELDHILNYVNLLKIYVKRKFNGKNVSKHVHVVEKC